MSTDVAIATIRRTLVQLEVRIEVYTKCIDQLRGLRTIDKPVVMGITTGETRRKRSTAPQHPADKMNQRSES